MSRPLTVIIKQQAEDEHQKISSAIILNDCDYLKNKYGSKEKAESRLQKLEEFLNYGK
ncbi:hypothetical protein [Enterococcus sp. AZ103]|uniref:hypothetical protein n=1 Tax=Enterococcus sp. AZ103 TaxID=2774628 RepID=UPI003F204CA9